MSTFNAGEHLTMETRDDGHFGDEADITSIVYVIDPANSGTSVISVPSDNTDVFVLLVCRVYREKMACKAQMERWDETVTFINATCTNQGPQCVQ